MPSEAARVAIGIGIVLSLSVASAWTYTQWTGPVAPPGPGILEDSGTYLVEYTRTHHELRLGPQIFPASGIIHWGDVPVPLQNVTIVEVTLEVSMEGPSAGDNFHIAVSDPNGTSRSADHAVSQPSSAGYFRAQTIITWHRSNPPVSDSYETHDRAEAARRAAENHTDRSATGPWDATVELNQPMVFRQGNASLVFVFETYEAVVFPKSSASPSPTENGTANNTTAPETGGEPAPGDPADVFADAPRTFNRRLLVGDPVDRGRSADRPL